MDLGVRPVTTASDLVEGDGWRRWPLDAVWDVLLPGGVARGGLVTITGGPGATGVRSLLFALAATGSAAGSWIALVDLPGLGVDAAAGLGVRADRLVVVPGAGRQWPAVMDALVGGVELIATRPP